MAADVNRGNRPLSPHIQVYKLPIAAKTSILNRATGHAMVAGILLLAWWLVAAATGPGAFACADWVVRSWIGFIVLTGAAWSLWFHALAGVRHMFYDAGMLMEIDQARQSSWWIIIGSVALTVMSLLLFFIA
ncbi:MAG: succinate dehydrogenase, cytochrome b556 subunit [Paracoccus sp. (in: a-proteobacteria)]|uniref:succinate dehydrogenase, cytochrome b556 subunit n=1 Tax=Paracoccus sp. TaxID=267 RepID=UPI0026E0B45B|nr:succinate dehydrogenase, cytochrome b556 subunit [Paracoccus sp. (in: a-proteobacteria)]MDO5614381.1 succinate dehydrogenase, cytochrome b556 subunit [Paracoccus sp. (in: a-proteobacteria)]MDO5631570.1 succinate dehydrogenase, cytochrome b556 subunit [Paracoccus sp. (in: a-proteobacteria)]